MQIVDRIEAKAGVTPHATRLAEVTEKARQNSVGLIIVRPVNQDLARKIAANCDAKIAILPHHSSVKGNLKGYIPFMEHIVSTFEKNLKVEQR